MEDPGLLSFFRCSQGSLSRDLQSGLPEDGLSKDSPDVFKELILLLPTQDADKDSA